MKVIVDTCIWSLVLRRNRPRDCPEVSELSNLIDDYKVQMLGPIRQELLSGISDQKNFKRLEDHLAGFPDLAITREDYIDAARFFNICRADGIQGSNPDFLICALSVRHDMAIYTIDNDFALFAEHLPIVLHR